MKLFEVDWDSLKECKKLSNMISSRMGELRKLESPGRKSKKEIVQLKFDACRKIMDTDISYLYDGLSLSNEKKFYVYVHCDPNAKIAFKRDGVSTFGATLGMTHLPFYVGKGCGDRAYELDRNDSHRKIRQRIKTFGSDILVNILKDGMTEIEALVMESKLIDMFGLISVGGRLANLDEGIKNKERRNKYATELKALSNFYYCSIKELL
jgi:hypothetical protein